MATNAPAPSVSSKPVNLDWPKQQPPKQPVSVPPAAGTQPPKEGQPPQQHYIPEVIIDCGRNKYYVRGIYLGRGGFARCYKIYDQKTAEQFACKIVDKRLLVKPQHRDKMAQEISIHRELGHEFIVKFHSYFEDDNNVYIVLELCARKSLLELQKRRRNLSEIEVRYYLRQILLGLDYLHSNKIIHRDLKLGNIFISEDMKLKIGDFGLATTLESTEERKRTLCGTPNYIAPEVLTKKGHSFEVDIWSTGCILFTLLVGRPPFETNSLKDTYMKIRHADYQIPQIQISTPMKELIRQMLLVDPVQRPTTKEILHSDYMTMGFIPRAMPVSALTVAPRFDKELAAAAGDSRPLLEHNPKSLDASIAVGPPTTMLAYDKMTTISADVVAANHVKTLLTQLKSVVASKPREKGVQSNDEVEDPNCAPMLWISKWVDYTDKYGFGYELSDDSMGVRFNDMTKMILLGDRSTLHYIDKQANEYYYTKTEYPLDLSKKVKLLNYFQQYMVENLLKAGGNRAMGETAAMTRLPTIWTWFRTSNSLIMILSNGTLQINNFKDHWKIILCPLMGAITTLGCDDKLDRTKEKTMRTFKFSAIETHGCTPGLFQKIQLAKDKLELVLKNQPTTVVQDANEDKPAIPRMAVPKVPKKKEQALPN